MKLPLRFRILHLLSEGVSLSTAEIMTNLQAEYAGEGQFKESIMNLHLSSMRAVGLIEVIELSLDAVGALQQKYKITDFGRKRLSYLPSSWQKPGANVAV
jgi:DNA-binding PadR family transcriptional regulator